MKNSYLKISKQNDSGNRGQRISFREALKETGYAALSAATINNKILIVKPKKF